MTEEIVRTNQTDFDKAQVLVSAAELDWIDESTSLNYGIKEHEFNAQYVWFLTREIAKHLWYNPTSTYEEAVKKVGTPKWEDLKKRTTTESK
jgi:hypothetical protein